jgi:NitT/TauT family transport system substrate-binding protein
MTRFRMGATILIAAALLIVGSAVYLLREAFSILPRETQKITVARTGGIPNSFTYIAEENGYFAAEGLDIHYIDYDQGPPALRALREKRADITSSGELPVVRSIMRGDAIEIVAELESDPGTNIIARKDLGVSTGYDMRGKTIGVRMGTVNEFALISFLESHGISENDVTLVDVDFKDAKDALLSAGVDVVSARQPTIVELEQLLGDRGVSFSAEGIYTFRFLLIANRDFIEANPEAVRKFVRAYVRAEKFMIEHPREAVAIVSRASEIELPVAEEAWTRHYFNINLSQPIFVSLEDEARWLISRDPALGNKIPNFLNYIYFDALEAEKPGAVTIPHR